MGPKVCVFPSHTMAVVVPVASPLEPIVIGLASFVAGTLFSQLPADLPAATAKFAQLVEEPSRIAGAAATYHLAQFAPNWHVYATTGAFVLLLLVFMADFYIYRGHFRTVSDVMSLVTLGVVIKQQMD